MNTNGSKVPLDKVEKRATELIQNLHLVLNESASLSSADQDASSSGKAFTLRNRAAAMLAQLRSTHRLVQFCAAGSNANAPESIRLESIGEIKSLCLKIQSVEKEYTRLLYLYRMQLCKELEKHKYAVQSAQNRLPSDLVPLTQVPKDTLQAQIVIAAEEDYGELIVDGKRKRKNVNENTPEVRQHAETMARLAHELGERKRLRKELKMEEDTYHETELALIKQREYLQELQPRLREQLRLLAPLRQDIRVEPAPSPEPAAEFLCVPLYTLYRQALAYESGVAGRPQIIATVHGNVSDAKKALQRISQQRSERLLSRAQNHLPRHAKLRCGSVSLDEAYQAFPLQVRLRISVQPAADEKSSSPPHLCELRFAYLPALEVVTVESYKIRASSISTSKSYAGGAAPVGELWKNLLVNLYPGDSGMDSPNPANQQLVLHVQPTMEQEKKSDTERNVSDMEISTSASDIAALRKLRQDKKGSSPFTLIDTTTPKNGIVSEEDDFNEMEEADWDTEAASSVKVATSSSAQVQTFRFDAQRPARPFDWTQRICGLTYAPVLPVNADLYAATKAAAGRGRKMKASFSNHYDCFSEWSLRLQARIRASHSLRHQLRSLKALKPPVTPWRAPNCKISRFSELTADAFWENLQKTKARALAHSFDESTQDHWSSAGALYFEMEILYRSFSLIALAMIGADYPLRPPQFGFIMRESASHVPRKLPKYLANQANAVALHTANQQVAHSHLEEELFEMETEVNINQTAIALRALGVNVHHEVVKSEDDYHTTNQAESDDHDVLLFGYQVVRLMLCFEALCDVEAARELVTSSNGSSVSKLAVDSSVYRETKGRDRAKRFWPQ